MKTVSKHRNDGNQGIKKLVRPLLILQKELEELDNYWHDFNPEVRGVIYSIDRLFEKMIQEEK